MLQFFSGKNQELGKGLFFKKKPEIKPTTPITSSTRAMKMKFYDYWENFCRAELPANRVSQFGRTGFSRMIGP